MGGRRFNELQRGLADISSALLTARLKSLEEQGIVARRPLNGQRGHEYQPTAACQASLPAILALGEWGLFLSRHLLVEDNFQVDFLMLYLERSIDTAQIPGNSAVIQFKFTDLTDQRDWWLLVNGDRVELCITPPGRDVDVYFTTTVRVMHDV